MKAYFIPGIGADYRLFTHIRLPEGYEPAYLHWIDPLEKEKLSDYAWRLTTQIDSTKPFLLIGMSLGGIMAVEIAKRLPPACTILISSIPDSDHLPGYYRLAGRLGLEKIVSPGFMKMASAAKHALTMRSPEDRKIMLDMIRTGDDRFIRWATSAVLGWENHQLPDPFYHIHGSRDEVFPIGLTRPTHIIEKAGHNFTLTKSETLNDLLKEIIALPASPFPL